MQAKERITTRVYGEWHETPEGPQATNRVMNPSITSTESRLLSPKFALGLGAFALVAAGCGSYPESTVVSAPPPAQPTQQVVVTQPQATAPHATSSTAVPTANGTIIVMQAPPAPQQEQVVARPSSEHVWVPGYWTWRNDRYEWRSGHWAVPPSTGAVWVSPKWERLADGSYRFTEGYWR